MGSWSAIYLKGALPPLDRLPVEGVIEVRTLGPWTELAPAGLQDLEPLAQALSAKTPDEVVAVQVQTTASVVGVTLHASGKVIRRVEHADGGWLRIEGTPQPWERELFSPEALEDELELGGDEAEVRAAFARGELSSGAHLPRPDEFGTRCLALGVTRADWALLRNQPAAQVLQGAKRSFGPLALAAATLACVVTAIATSGDVRAVFAALAGVGLPVTLGAGFLRKLRVGRWFV